METHEKGEATETGAINCCKMDEHPDREEPSGTGTSGSHTNIPCEELDDTTRQKLRGDAIGDTMYRESFVIKALLGLRDVHWDNDFEEVLMTLWDMSIDRDVSLYLHEMNYPSLISTVVAEHPDNDRLIEILVGIVSNMVSTCKDRRLDGEFLEELGVLFVKCNDPLTLIQLLRVFSGHCIVTGGDLSFLQEAQMEKINYILENSNNKELLTVTISAVKNFTWDFYLPSAFITDTFVRSLFIGYGTILQPRYDYEDHRDAVKDALEVMCNVCAYYENCKSSSKPEVIKTADGVRSHTQRFVHHMEKLMKYYGRKERAVPRSVHFDYYLETVDFMCGILCVEYNRTIFTNLCKIIHYFSKEGRVNESCLHLAKYFINRSSSTKLINDFRCLGSGDVIVDILKLVKEKYVAMYDQKLDHCIEYFSSSKIDSPSPSGSGSDHEVDNDYIVSDKPGDNGMQESIQSDAR